MSWICYRLVYRLEAPLRVGQREVGNLQETRRYVSGRVVWAALTARLTRNQGQGLEERCYRAVGESLQAGLRFGYLWPTTDQEKERFFWEKPAEFDYTFLGSSTNTALDYYKQGAEAGSLHETEYIARRTRFGEQVYLVGFIWARSDFELPGWQDALAQAVLGGERRYGWGRLALLSAWEPYLRHPIQDPEGFNWSAPLRAHALPVSERMSGWTGVVEPLVGWETRQGGRNTLSERVRAAYVPGTRLPGETLFRILEKDGVWEELA